MSFTLTRKSLNLPVGDEQHAVYPLEIVCSTPEDQDPKIFVYQAAIGLQPGLGDVFSCVASPLQLRQLPEDAPGIDPQGLRIPFFRKNVLRLDCSHSAQVNSIWLQVVQQVEDLQEDLLLEPELATEITVVIQ